MFASFQVINLSQLNALLLSSRIVIADHSILANCKCEFNVVAETIMLETKDVAHYLQVRKGRRSHRKLLLIKSSAKAIPLM